MTPVSWALLGWALFASLLALSAHGSMLGDRRADRERIDYLHEQLMTVLETKHALPTLEPTDAPTPV